MVQRPDGRPLAVISWATPQIDPGASTAELHVLDPEAGAVHDLGRIEREVRSWATSALRSWEDRFGAERPPSRRVLSSVCGTQYLDAMFRRVAPIGHR